MTTTPKKPTDWFSYFIAFVILFALAVIGSHSCKAQAFRTPSPVILPYYGEGKGIIITLPSTLTAMADCVPKAKYERALAIIDSVILLSQNRMREDSSQKAFLLRSIFEMKGERILLGREIDLYKEMGKEYDRNRTNYEALIELQNFRMRAYQKQLGIKQDPVMTFRQRNRKKP